MGKDETTDRQAICCIEDYWYDNSECDLISVIRPGTRDTWEVSCMSVCSLYTYLHPSLARPHFLAPRAKPLHPLTILVPAQSSFASGDRGKRTERKNSTPTWRIIRANTADKRKSYVSVRRILVNVAKWREDRVQVACNRCEFRSTQNEPHFRGMPASERRSERFFRRTGCFIARN